MTSMTKRDMNEQNPLNAVLQTCHPIEEATHQHTGIDRNKATIVRMCCVPPPLNPA